jgi:predicted transcriptional regulator
MISQVEAVWRIPTGAEIRQSRKKAGMTQRQLASKVGVSQGLIAKIENGSVDPKMSTLRRIVGAFEHTGSSDPCAKNVMTTDVISVRHDDTVAKAIRLMTTYDISQLPVMKGNETIGCVEEDHLVALLGLQLDNPRRFYKKPIIEVISGYFPAVRPEAPLVEILELLAGGHKGVLVKEEGRVLGIITKIDVLKALGGR